MPRFIILDDVELFNNNSLNALLKMIEEPSILIDLSKIMVSLIKDINTIDYKLPSYNIEETEELKIRQDMHVLNYIPMDNLILFIIY